MMYLTAKSDNLFNKMAAAVERFCVRVAVESYSGTIF